jgi:hypothetical protein
MRETPGGSRRRDGARWSEDECPDTIRDALRQPVELGDGARDRLASALARETVRRPAPRLAGAARWLVRPLRMPLPPLAVGAAAAALVMCGILVGRGLARDDGSRARADATADATMVAARPAAARHADSARVVRFVLVAPRAGRVALVGDFNAWDAARTPMRATGDGGVWTVEVPVSAGRYLYAFVVDGTQWVADPAAPLAPEEDFGTRNSVLVVGGET